MDTIGLIIAARSELRDVGNELADRIILVHDETSRLYRPNTSLGTGGVMAGLPLDGSSPDTSRPYFLDLIGRIDAVTANRSEYDD